MESVDKKVSEKQRVLWVGEKLTIESGNLFLSPVLNSKNFSPTFIELEFFLATEVALEDSLIIFSLIGHRKNPVSEDLNRLNKKFLNPPPESSLILFILEESQTTFFEISTIINSFSKSQILLWPREANVWELKLMQLADFQQKLFNHQLSLKGTHEERRQLEAITKSLEDQIEERTTFLTDSMNLESEKMAKQRQIVKFIKDLSLSQTEEDVLGVLRKDLKRIIHIREPIIWLTLLHDNLSAPIKSELIFFQNNHYRRLDCTSKPEILGSQFWISTEGIEFLATLLQRPFTKAIQLLHSQGSHDLRIILEVDLPEIELKNLTENLKDRLAYMSVAIDRLYFEETVKESSTLWETTFNQIKDPILVVNKEYKVLRMNREFSQKDADLYCYQLLMKRETSCEDCPLKLRPDRVQTIEIKAQNHLYELHSYPLRGDLMTKETGSPSAPVLPELFVHHYVDKTESTELYLKALQNEKISAIGLLAGNIAHELNNPLTGIRSLTQVLKKELTEELKKISNEQSEKIGFGNLVPIPDQIDKRQIIKDLAEIENATERCQRIIKNLLEFSTPGLASLQKVKFDELIEKTLPLLKSVTRLFKFSLSLNAVIEGQRVDVLVEPYLIQQVIFNLVNNACQAMGRSGQISLQSRIIDAKFVELSLLDSGPGIPLEIQNKIFEPFFTTKNEGIGTGLGLSMSRQIITRFAGQITFHSVPGQGTTFFIKLPIEKSGVAN